MAGSKDADLQRIKEINKEHNPTTSRNSSIIKKDVFNIETLDHVNKLKNKFFNS